MPSATGQAGAGRGGARDVAAMRASRDVYRAVLRSGGYGEWRECRVVTLGGYRYIQTGDVQLRFGRQRVEVIDITDRPNVALFSRFWPDYNERQWALVFVPNEGHSAVLCEDGNTQWVRYADLTIQLQPGSAADVRETLIEQGDELNRSVDAGGSVL